MSNNKIFWRVNSEIRSPEVRVIGADDKQIGVMALEKAISKAKEAKLDLVEIAPKAKPPVVKIVDFGKFRYREEKKLRSQKKKVKQTELKEIRFSPFIGEQDYTTRINRVREFLKDKNKVRLVVKFKGRQMGSTKFGYNLLKKIEEEFDQTINVDMKPKFIGRHLTMVISPLTQRKAKKTDENQSKNEKLESRK